MSSWRKAGISYVQYLTQCTKTVRASIKPEVRAKLYREDPDSLTVTIRKWTDGQKIEVPSMYTVKL